MVCKYIEELTFTTYKDYTIFKQRFSDLFKDHYVVPTKGKDIINYRLKRKKLINTWGLITRDKTKYVYPTERITIQDKKSMRTKLRRQKRTWGYSLDNRFI